VVDGLFEVIGRFAEMGTSVLVVEQFVDRALAVASRAYVLDKGEVAYDGSAASLAADEKFVSRSYLGDLDEAVSLGARPEDGHAEVLTEDVRVSLPPVMLRELQRRAEDEGLALDELLRLMVETADLADRTRVREPASDD
jgi:ABC-type multidrug transport system ATPase subunit